MSRKISITTVQKKIDHITQAEFRLLSQESKEEYAKWYYRKSAEAHFAPSAQAELFDAFLGARDKQLASLAKGNHD